MAREIPSVAPEPHERKLQFFNRIRNVKTNKNAGKLIKSHSQAPFKASSAQKNLKFFEKDKTETLIIYFKVRFRVHPLLSVAFAKKQFAIILVCKGQLVSYGNYVLVLFKWLTPWKVTQR